MCVRLEAVFLVLAFAEALQEASTGNSKSNRRLFFRPCERMGRKNKGRGVTTPTWDERDDITPFKLAEKRFKRYKGRQTDFSEVLDFEPRQPDKTCADTVRSTADNGSTADIGSAILNPGHCIRDDVPADPRPSAVDGCGGGQAGGEEQEEGKGARVVHVPGRDGLIVLPGFLSAEEQLRLAERCLTGRQRSFFFGQDLR